MVDGPSGRREIPAEEFFVTHFTTALDAGELVVETVWPLAATGESSAFEELALRAGDFAQSMVAVVLRRDAGGTVVDASVAVGAVSDHPTPAARGRERCSSDRPVPKPPPTRDRSPRRSSTRPAPSTRARGTSAP